MKIEYLKATPSDEAQIISILNTLNGDRANFNIDNFLVGKDGQKVIACVRVKVFSSNVLELASLAVLPEYQGQGIGSEILKKFLIFEKTRPIFLLTSSDKEVFYKKFNFILMNKEELPELFKREYLRIVSFPFTKDIRVVAMILK